MSRPQPSSGTEAVKEFDEELFVDEDEGERVHPADSTFEPDEKPAKEKGTQFEPFELPEDRDPDPIPRDLPSTPLLLFQHFIPIFLVQKWVFYTNQHVEALKKDPNLHRKSRLHNWIPVSVQEIYLWLGILIHLGIHKEIRIEDHWNIPAVEEQGTYHTIIRFMTLKRFNLILRYIRLFPLFDTSKEITSYDRTFGRVDEWSDYIQKITTDLVILGLNCAIDECMVGYKGRSYQTTIVKGKPTPRGLKVWAVAQKGLLLRWIWHIPKQPFGLLARWKEGKKNWGLNPTQAVVVMLVLSLPKAIYHVFFDNLFSTPKLLTRLRDEGFGATATARVTSGIFKPYVDAKSGFKFNQIETAPTPDNKVNSLKNTFIYNL
jgi:hypothetical protein